ncbi:flagellar hook-associated protein FlgK [Porphyrobacter algicida]|uniref:Flagellar hook-associated protein 1 n=1 Tax=Qipengyuania algicida TaxID=1836209 RepID=A0A845AGD6_9SPHN|nr:flagellar hook-associated protein FlgK [Qipengyuania algicida]MXP27616.1 flagellar hook-associated protein FlgK [Qipengyuania algicida]
MASDLLTIGASGARAARSALDVTAQNIANANTEGYVRRSVSLEEVAGAGSAWRQQDLTLAGVRVAGVDRNVDLFRQSEVRRTSGDASRASAELQGLENIESAVEQARPYEAVVGFEAALRQLASDPLSSDLRAAAIGAAQSMAGAFNLASSSLGAVGAGATFSANAGVEDINSFATQIARINRNIARTGAGSSERATLLDQRDNLLGQMADTADVSISFKGDGQVAVRMGGASGPALVDGINTGTLNMSVQADGTLAFDVDGTAVTIASGELAGHASTLTAVNDARTQLDASANGIAAIVNSSQAAGVDRAGNSGQPLFSGTGAAGLTVATTDGAALATAPAGSGAQSLDGGNLSALIGALDSGGVASGLSNSIYQLSQRASDQQMTSDALGAIASGAKIALDQQSGVDLDQEAANLVRFQQAFQASARSMQAASDIFDTLLGVGR